MEKLLKIHLQGARQEKRFIKSNNLHTISFLLPFYIGESLIIQEAKLTFFINNGKVAKKELTGQFTNDISNDFLMKTITGHQHYKLFIESYVDAFCSFLKMYVYPFYSFDVEKIHLSKFKNYDDEALIYFTLSPHSKELYCFTINPEEFFLKLIDERWDDPFIDHFLPFEVIEKIRDFFVKKSKFRVKLATLGLTI